VIDDERLYQAIGKRLKGLREANDLTQADLAKTLGFERTSITNIERGRQRPGVHVLYRICAYFQVPIDKLLPAIDSDEIAPRKLPPEAARALEKVRASRQ
jgi:transcriptional regulator with XRE-family HTH domain